MLNKLQICQGDITNQIVDAIVNAANSSLLGGSGVDGAIHRKGGAQILEDCLKIRQRIGGCKVGNAVITRAGNLPAKYVLHAVGPRWVDGNHNEVELLKKTYQSCFELIKKNGFSTVAFPNISTGTFNFPKTMAAQIAIEEISQFLLNNEFIESISIVCYEQDSFMLHKKIMDFLINPSPRSFD
jgi:O-acetyl-ADP-ribose deacetylase (regulator of RNase III)